MACAHMCSAFRASHVVCEGPREPCRSEHMSPVSPQIPCKVPSGHDADGERALGGGAWNGTDLTPLGKHLWREYIAKHGIVASVHARHTVDFS